MPKFSIKTKDFLNLRLPQGREDRRADRVQGRQEGGRSCFAQSEAGIWVGLPGRSRSSTRWPRAAKDKSGSLKAEAAAKSVDEKDADSAKYVKVMTKATDKADFLTKEVERLQKMIDDGSVKASKKEAVRPPAQHPLVVSVSAGGCAIAEGSNGQL